MSLLYLIAKTELARFKLSAGLLIWCFCSRFLSTPDAVRGASTSDPVVEIFHSHQLPRMCLTNGLLLQLLTYISFLFLFVCIFFCSCKSVCLTMNKVLISVTYLFVGRFECIFLLQRLLWTRGSVQSFSFCTVESYVSSVIHTEVISF